MSAYDFSFLLCTLNRTDEVACFLRSLAKRDPAPSLEVIVVDQNPDDRLESVLAPFREKFPIKRLRCKPGLSRARNLALAEASGAILAFPDDDCVYPETLPASVLHFFEEHPECGALSTLVTDEAGRFSAGGRMYLKPCKITRKNVWWCAVSPSIFVRRESAGDLRFDESLGVGAGTIFGSGEETDYLLSLLERGVSIAYEPSLLVLHPRFTGPWKKERGFSYGCGMGRVLRKHKRSFFTAFYYASLQGVRAAQSLFSGRWKKALFHLAMSAGRIRGYLASPGGRRP